MMEMTHKQKLEAHDSIGCEKKTGAQQGNTKPMLKRYELGTVHCNEITADTVVGRR